MRIHFSKISVREISLRSVTHTYVVLIRILTLPQWICCERGEKSEGEKRKEDQYNDTEII